MARPSTSASWATDTNLASGPDSGLPTKETPDPSAGVIAQGFIPGLALFAPRLNWIINLLAKWVAYFATCIDASDEFVYPTPPTRTRVFTIGEFTPEVYSEWNAALASMIPNAVNKFANVYLTGLPLGAAVSTVKVLFHASTARATSGDRWQAKLYRQSLTFSSPAVTTTQLGSTQTDSGSSGLSVATFSSVAETINAQEDLFIQIESPGTSLGASDAVYGVEVTFTDPGPRNF